MPVFVSLSWEENAERRTCELLSWKGSPTNGVPGCAPTSDYLTELLVISVPAIQ